MEEEIKAEFERSGFSIDEEDILKKCLTFCINCKLTPSDLVSSWEVYYLNRQLSGSLVQNAQMDGFLLHLQNEQKDAIIKEEPNLHIYSSNDVDMILCDEHEDTKEGILGTPTDRPENIYPESFDITPGTTGNRRPSSGKPSRLASNNMTPFGQRTSKFVVQSAFNNPLDEGNDVKEQEIDNTENDIIRRVQPIKRCSLQVCGSQPEPGCRFMYDRVEDRFNSLENRIRRHAIALVASGLYEEPTDPTVASQNKVFSVGMVCCDGEGRLNEKSVLLQGSVEHCGGQRVRLDLHKLTQFSLFPGQVVGIEGHNPSGHCFVASKVVDYMPLSISPNADLAPAKKQHLDEEFNPPPSNMLEELSLIIAAGPFTTTDNLFFEPLSELLAYATRKQPQLLMLLGPFVDSEHPDIKKAAIDRSFEEVFHEEVLKRVQDYAAFMGSAARVVLVPSIRDAHHDFVFPQPPLDIHFSDLKHQITSFANPGLFDANKVKIGCCSMDILRQLSGEEISRNPANGLSGDRMGRLACHLVNQRSFYPLYPPAEGVPLDLSLVPEALQIPSVPDILVLPSDLAPFVKVLPFGQRMNEEEQVKCICINPGRLAKGVGGGTFVELNYHGNADRTSASVIRI
ncbi:PREDICTED: DNA polymerase alpha subunit B isoform X2 [Nelumbo nucifera]|uniref:DNA polymerase alpha subunit B n=1 Tax=Nelumbo nucifera TaxID=4432 RepID=A0A1U7ZH75_NELNU|nr:PREDICTED: DNA polymerase alpha subunit B isoform X2 [Nelumbo nucifera]